MEIGWRAVATPPLEHTGVNHCLTPASFRADSKEAERSCGARSTKEIVFMATTIQTACRVAGTISSHVCS